MTIHNWLFMSMDRLGKAGTDSPRRDSLVLLEDTLGKDRAWVLANPEYQLEQEQLDKLELLIKRRVEREPLAYIRKKAWFYGRFFDVSPDVMIPRPESEDFIDMLKESGTEKVLDIGSGSGCLAITAKLELPKARVLACDTSQEAIETARRNAKRHEVEISWLKGSLLKPFEDKDMQGASVIANLPYVPEGMVSSPEIRHEPAEALFSGKDGLRHYKKLWEQIKSRPSKPEAVLVESLKDQHEPMEKLAKNAQYELEKTSGLVQLFGPAG